MNIQFIKCPVCKQKLAILPYVQLDTLIVCANLDCGTSLRLIKRDPLKVEEVREADTYSIDYRPESYG